MRRRQVSHHLVQTAQSTTIPSHTFTHSFVSPFPFSQATVYRNPAQSLYLTQQAHTHFTVPLSSLSCSVATNHMHRPTYHRLGTFSPIKNHLHMLVHVLADVKVLWVTIITCTTFFICFLFYKSASSCHLSIKQVIFDGSTKFFHLHLGLLIAFLCIPARFANQFFTRSQGDAILIGHLTTSSPP